MTYLKSSLQLNPLTLLRIRGSQNVSPYQFFPGKRISPQKCLTLSFNSFAVLVQYVETILSVNLKLFNLYQEHHSKNYFFCINLYKTEVMIIYLIEMLELPNFGPHLQCNLSHLIILVTSWR